MCESKNTKASKTNIQLGIACWVLAISAFAHCATFDMLSCCPGENTATQARFAWHSDSDSCLLFCAKASDPSGLHTILPRNRVTKPVDFREPNVTYYKYEAEISDLEPGTEYVYWIEAGGETSARQKFKSAGTDGSFNFLWMSDVHADPRASDKMKTVERLRQDAEARTAASGGIDMVLFSGDAVKYGSRYDNWRQWNDASAMTNYTFAAVPGNKEYYYTGSSTFYDYNWYLAVKNNPPNGPDATEQEGCYWFLRDGVMFVGIDSLIHKGSRMAMYGEKTEVLSAQTNWFDNVVTSQRGKFRWLVVFQHDPWFVCSSDGFDKSRGNYDVWRHVFDKHKVDLALSGDEHNYIRSKPLRGDAANAEGTIYMVAGEINATNYSATVTTDIASYGNSSATKYFDCMGATDASCGAAFIEVSPGSLKVTEFWDKWQSPNYKVYDTVTIAPKNRGWVFEAVGARAHTRYRFAVDAPRSDDSSMQISEIQLLDANGNRISSGYTLDYDTVTTNSTGKTYPSGENPANAADGKTSTKWLDWRAGLKQSAEVRSAVWLDFCFSTPVTISGYRWYTANDDSSYPSRQPVSWTLSAFDDNDDTAYILDQVVGYDPPKTNKTLAYPLPEEPGEPEEPSEPEEPGATVAGGTYYALSIGVGQFSSGNSALKGTVPDAKNVLSACTNAVNGMWRPANCSLLTNEFANLSSVRAQFQSIANQARSGDTVLYYHSSHGGDDCICCYDKNYYADDFAEDLMRFQTGVRVIVVLDTCHSGSMFKGADDASSMPWDFAASVQAHMAELQAVQTKGVKASSSGPSVGWITACDDDQTSLDVGTGGWFTKPFVEAWKSASTDLNGDGYNDFKEAFNIAAPKAIDHERAPQTMNESLLRSVAVWQLRGRPYTWDASEWIAESAETPTFSGAWSNPVAYGTDGRASISDNAFTPYTASTGNVVMVETRAQFCGCSDGYTPGVHAQAAIRLSTNGCFQVWSGGAWTDVVADGFTPVSGAEYTIRPPFDSSAKTYSVDVKNANEWIPLNSSTPNSQLTTSSFPLAAATNCVTRIGFVGETDFTSLLGNCTVVATGFAENEEVALAGAATVLTAARAIWLNSLGDKATVAGAAASISADDFDAAYLLNFDFTKGGFSYTFKITSIEVLADCVKVEVALVRDGVTNGDINGTLNFYGATTLEAFRSGGSLVGTATLNKDAFGDGEKASVTIPKDGKVFFNAKIEE